MVQDLSNFMSEVWTKKFMTPLKKNTVMKALVNTDYEGEAKENKTVQIRVFPSTIPTNAYTDTCVYSELQSVLVPLLLDQKVQFGFMVDDVSEAQSNLNIIEGHLTAGRNSTEIAVDTALLALNVDVDAGNVIATSKITKNTVYADLVAVSVVLKNNYVTAAQKPYCVIPTAVEALLIQAPEFIQANTLGANTLTEGSIGKVAGMDIFVSTNMTDIGGTYRIFASHKGAVTIAGSLSKIEQLRDKGSFGTFVRGLYVFGALLAKPLEAAVKVCTV